MRERGYKPRARPSSYSQIHFPLRLPRDPPRLGSGLTPRSPFTSPPPLPCQGRSSTAAAARVAVRLRKCPDAPTACCTGAQMREEGKGACEAGEAPEGAREPGAC